jgi:uncharacterized membrane protein
MQRHTTRDALSHARPARNLGNSERLVSGAAGAATLLWAMRRGGVPGGLLAVLGTTLIARAASGYCPVVAATSATPTERRIARKQGWRSAAATVRSVTIARPPADVYRFFREVRNLPRFLQHVEQVTAIDEMRSHWLVRAPTGRTVEWDTIITEDQPNERIAWRSAPGADLQSVGWIKFRPAPGDRGTEVHASIAYEPPAGQLGRIAAELWNDAPGGQAQGDLRRLKQVLETGEVPTPAMRRPDTTAAMPAA